MFKVTNKQELLMVKLTNFFCIPKNIETMIPIIESKSTISLRIIDWFVTNYSKKFNISYHNTKKKEKQDKSSQFIVYLNYKKQLKAYSKKEFDPFCRRERITFYYTKDKFITTTVGQLNFFRWSITNNIIKYIEKNLQDIESDMNISLKKVQNGKVSTSDNSIIKRRKKRQELSISATKKVNKHNVKIVVQFE